MIGEEDFLTKQSARSYTAIVRYHFYFYRFIPIRSSHAVVYCFSIDKYAKIQ